MAKNQTDSADVRSSCVAAGWMAQVNPGDSLRIKPLWNQTSTGGSLVDVPTVIEDVIVSRGCQSGILFEVKDRGGRLRRLDAGWFEPPNAALSGSGASE